MTSSWKFTFCSRSPITENIPQRIRALRAAPPGSLNPPLRASCKTCTERGGVRVQKCVPSDEITGMLHLKHGAPRLFRSNRYENASFARFIAGDLGFLVLIQSHDGPAR